MKLILATALNTTLSFALPDLAEAKEGRGCSTGTWPCSAE